MFPSRPFAFRAEDKHAWHKFLKRQLGVNIGGQVPKPDRRGIDHDVARRHLPDENHPPQWIAPQELLLNAPQQGHGEIAKIRVHLQCPIASFAVDIEGGTN